MIYGYIRVSTDKQTVENQKFEILSYCKKERLHIDRWIEETVSGTEEVENRQLGALLNEMDQDDMLICTELSRLGRNLLMIMAILNRCIHQGIKVQTTKDNFRLDNGINSKVLAFAFGISAEIERNLISLRTKEALARKRSEGVVLGRPKGSISHKKKLDGQEKELLHLYRKRVSISAMARILGVHRQTVAAYLKTISNRYPQNTQLMR